MGTGVGQKQWWYFTFMYGSEKQNNYVKFFGTYEEAREQMFKHFGCKWAFQYSGEEFGSQIEEFGLQEIKV